MRQSPIEVTDVAHVPSASSSWRVAPQGLPSPSAAVPARPKTRNPALESKVLTTPRNGTGTPLGSRDTPTNPTVGRDPEVAGVLWSETSFGLADGDIARPHTSNPAYATALRDTPSREKGTPRSSANESPSSEQQPGGDQQSTKAVLWAQDSMTIEPGLIVRPRTSNPWAHRQLDTAHPQHGSGRFVHFSPSPTEHSPHRSGAAAIAHDDKNGILWSSNDVPDWHLLARPHASNPNIEHKMLNEPLMADPCSGDCKQQLVAAQVLPVRNENVTDLQNIVAAQSERISLLEHEVNDLRQRLATALGVSVAVLFPSPPGVIAPSVGAGASVDVLDTVAAGDVVPQSLSDADDALTPSYGDAAAGGAGQLSPVVRSPSHAIADSSIFDAAQGSPPPAFARAHTEIPSPLAPGGATAAGSTDTAARYPTDDEAMHFVQEDRPVAGDETFERDFETVTTQAQRSISPAAAARRQARPQTAGPGHVHHGHHHQSGANAAATAASSGLGQRVEPVPFRPMSAPLRPPSSADSSTIAAAATMNSFIESASAMLVDTDRLQWEFSRLRCGPAPVVAKSDFRDFYMRRAAEFGMAPSARELDRQLKRFSSAGPDVLTLDEFSVLYLKIAAW